LLTIFILDSILLRFQVPTSLARTQYGEETGSESLVVAYATNMGYLFVTPYIVKMDFSNPYAMLVNKQGNAKANSLPVLGSKSTIDLLVEYLSILEKAITSNIQAVLGVGQRTRFKTAHDYESLLYNNIQYCFAVPHGWPASGKEAFSFAARAAKLSGLTCDSGITFISEIEATVLHYVDEGKFDLTDGDVILVVNCEDDSLDLAAYTVNNTDQFLVALTPPTGGLFG
jgi:hypothetical protein